MTLADDTRGKSAGTVDELRGVRFTWRGEPVIVVGRVNGSLSVRYVGHGGWCCPHCLSATEEQELVARIKEG